MPTNTACPREAAAASKLPAGGGGGRKLIDVERRKLRRDQVGRVADVAEAVLCGDRELRGIVEPRIVERALALHLEIGDERVPVRDRSPAGPGMQVDAGQVERRRNQRRR